LLLGTPVDEVGRVKSDAKEISGHETELSGTDADDADDGAIERGHNPALPEFLAEEDSAQDGQNAGEIIESNHVEHVQHGGLTSRGCSLFKEFNGALGLQFSFLKE
jgi:hypothetical protein